MKTKTKISLIAVCSVIAILFVAAMIYYFGASYPQFNAIAQQEFAIPGLETDFSPQGLTYNQTHEIFLVSGYMSKDGPSRIYLIKKGESQASKYITLTINNENYHGHCGGITTVGDDVLIVGDKQIYRFSLTAVLNAENGESLSIIDSRTTNNGADFILSYHNQIIVGEFHRQQNYPTPESHHLTTTTGTVNPALALVFDLSETSTCGISEKPVAGISIPGFVQGMSFTKDGNIVLSSSYGLPDSKLLVYQNVLATAPTLTKEVDGQTLPIYLLSENEMEKTIIAPCMSEEIILVNERVFVLFESACSKYKMFTRTRLKHVYSLDL